MKVWIIISLMFLIEDSQVKIAETTMEGNRFFKTERQCLNSLENKMVDGEKLGLKDLKKLLRDSKNN